MKLFMYDLRLFDEMQYCEKYSKEMNIEFDHCPDYPSLENAHLAEGYDAVSMTPCTVDAKLVDKFHSYGVKYIVARSIGYDHIDLTKAKECNMRIANVSYPPDGVANYAIMLMMMCLRNMPHILKRSGVQDYTLQGKIGRDISNCSVGVIGTGKIGTTVIKHLSGFGCKMYALDNYKNDTVSQYAEYTDLDTLLAKSDIITLHANATDENHHLINAETIAKMKPGVILINTARGKLIDTDALIDALESKQVGMAALDVLEKEDGLYYANRMNDVIVNREMAILRSFPNVILSPHTAFYTDITVDYMVKGCFESVYAFENGLETPHEIKL